MSEKKMAECLENGNLVWAGVNSFIFYAGGDRLQNLCYWCCGPGLHGGFVWK